MTAASPGRLALSLALWIGAGSSLARVAILYLLEHFLRGNEASFTLWRIAQLLPFVCLHAWLAGALVVIGGLLARRGGWARLGGPLLGALTLYSALAGWPWAEAGQIPATHTRRGVIAIGAMAALALVTAVLAAILLRRRAADAPPPRLAARSALAGGVLLALAFPLGFHFAFGGAPKERTAHVVVHDIAFEPELWKVVKSRRRAPPEAKVLTPSMKYKEDGGDLPALALYPPCEVEVSIPEEHGLLILRGRSGVDLSIAGLLRHQTEPVSIRLEVLVDGRLAANHVHRVSKDRKDSAGRLWQDLGGEAGIAVEPGQKVILRTAVDEAAGTKLPARLPIGVGAFVLEKRETRQTVPSSPDTPNVVLIVMDTLRWDRLSCYGHEPGTTPHLDSLAERGLLYENAYATSNWTWPSTASILTGLHPETHGVLEDGSCYLHQQVESLPELLEARNFTTGAFSTNPLIVPNKNFDQGFEHFDSYHLFRGSQRVIGEVQAWIRMNAGSRFFLYLHLTDPHETYHPRPEAVERAGGVRPDDYPASGLNAYREQLLKGEGRDEDGRPAPDSVVPPAHQQWMHHAYDAAMITADHFVGEVLAELAAAGLEDRTVIAFTSDHGEELLDHGLLTHGQSLYPELVRVPLILAGPGLPRGERSEVPVSNRHLAPTLAAVGNAAFRREQDALDLSQPGTLAEKPIFFSSRQGWWNGTWKTNLYGLREGDWELHWAPEGASWGESEPPPDGQIRLFDLRTDPEQHTDLAEREPERAAEMKERLRAHLETARRDEPRQSIGAGKQGLQGLDDIGYAGGDEDDDEEDDANGRKPR